MVDLANFKQLQKDSARSFNDQKALIKKVISGREIKCDVCRQLLTLNTPESSERPGIRCKKGCTDIELDFS